MTAERVYGNSVKDPIRVHLQRVTRCPPDFPAGCFWYGDRRSGPGRPPKWIDDFVNTNTRIGSGNQPDDKVHDDKDHDDKDHDDEDHDDEDHDDEDHDDEDHDDEDHDDEDHDDEDHDDEDHDDEDHDDEDHDDEDHDDEDHDDRDHDDKDHDDKDQTQENPDDGRRNDGTPKPKGSKIEKMVPSWTRTRNVKPPTRYRS